MCHLARGDPHAPFARARPTQPLAPSRPCETSGPARLRVVFAALLCRRRSFLLAAVVAQQRQTFDIRRWDTKWRCCRAQRRT